MGINCQYCNNFFQEDEIISNKTANNNSLKDFDSKDLISKDSYIINENKAFILQSNSSKLINIQNDLFNSEILTEINNYRLQHNVEAITMEQKINKIAQKHSEKLARESELELSGNKYKDQELGEIIFSYQDDITPKELVDLWYKEGSTKYNYKIEPKTSNSFTQLIWKNSKLCGIGHSTTRDNKLYIVVNFYPKGNITGEFLKNILPPKKINNEKNSKNDGQSNVSFTTDFLEEILFAHNELRAKHNSPPLDLDPNLSILAQKHSEFLAKKEKLISSNKNTKIRN